MGLGAYVGRRLLLAVPVLLGVTLLTFVISWVANEGHMERAYLTEKMTPAQREAIVRQYGFDRPWYEQYFSYLKRLASLDLGFSRVEGDRPIVEVYREFLPATMELAGAAMIVAVVGGIFLGTLSAIRRDEPIDQVTRVVALSGVSVPIFWLGLLLKFLLATEYPEELLLSLGPIAQGLFFGSFVGALLLLVLLVAETIDPRKARGLGGFVLFVVPVGVGVLFLLLDLPLLALLFLGVGGGGGALSILWGRWGRGRLPRRVFWILPALALAFGLAGALGGLGELEVRTVFDLIPRLPLGGRFSNDLLLVPQAHPSLTEGPTRILLVDTLLAGDWVAFGDVVRHLIIPGVTLGYATMAIVARMMRASMLEILPQDFVRTARSKGLPEKVVIRRHARRNALIPVTTVIGLAFGGLLSGAVLTETIFQWPGLGRWSTKAILASDTSSIMSFTLLVVLIYLLANFVVDVLYSALDPRVRLE